MTARVTLPAAVIGSGPVGLAAAVHLLRRGIEPLILEAGDTPAAAVAHWSHVRLFSPWRECIDASAADLLARSSWRPPDLRGYPTGAELRDRYLAPLADTVELRSRLRLGTRVTAVSRLGHDKLPNDHRATMPFEITTVAHGQEERLRARAVIDASGTLETPNPLGGSGVPASGEAELAQRIAYDIPDILRDAHRYAGKRVLVVGAGHSAMTVVADLARLREAHPSTRIVWAMRGNPSAERPSVANDEGALPKREALVDRAEQLVREGLVERISDVLIKELRIESSGKIVVRHARGSLTPVDEVVAATGFRPDLSLLRELRVALDPRFEAPPSLVSLIDPQTHTCGTVPLHGAAELAHPEPNLYIVGLKSYGRAPTFLMRNGYEQVRSVAAALAGDHPAASRRVSDTPELIAIGINR